MLFGALTMQSFNYLPGVVTMPGSHDNGQKYMIRLIDVSKHTYGYEIYVDNRVFIRQVTIPGVAGNTGFQRKSDAGKVANLVLSKLHRGIMPPVIEKKEMERLRIQF